MDGVGLAAIITAATGALATIGAGLHYVLKMILDAYKQQVESTEAAKNGEIAALEERIDRHMEDIAFLRTTVNSQADTIAVHEETIIDLHERQKEASA